MQLSRNSLAKTATIVLLAALAIAAFVLMRDSEDRQSKVSVEEENAAREALQAEAPPISKSEEERIRNELAKPPSFVPSGAGGGAAAPSLSEKEIERIREELRK